jgi:hypothetical protein
MSRNWEQVSKGLEEIAFPALAGDEKLAQPTSIIRMCVDRGGCRGRVLTEVRKQDRQGDRQLNKQIGRVAEGPTAPDTDGATQVALSRRQAKRRTAKVIWELALRAGTPSSLMSLAKHSG